MLHLAFELKSSGLWCSHLTFPSICSLDPPLVSIGWLLTQQRRAWSIITQKEAVVCSKNEAHVFVIKAASLGASDPFIDCAPKGLREHCPREVQGKTASFAVVISGMK